MNEVFEFDGGWVRLTLAGRVIARMVQIVWYILAIATVLLALFLVGLAAAGKLTGGWA